MLGSKKPSAPASVAPPTGEGKPVDTIDTLIGQKAVFKGDLEFSGGLRVDGHVKGNVIAREESNSTVVVSESGEVEGNITVPHVVVNGTINGNIKSGGRVELQSKAKINGDVHYKAVEMELGASINGNLVCQTSGVGSSSAGNTGMGAASSLGASGKNPEQAQPAAAKSG
jgi:cytoskeletal protein CcmA (bactofilin family)